MKTNEAHKVAAAGGDAVVAWLLEHGWSSTRGEYYSSPPLNGVRSKLGREVVRSPHVADRRGAMAAAIRWEGLR